MTNENYFDKIKKEIDDLQRSIDRLKRNISMPDDEIRFMFEDSTKTHAQRCEESRKQDELFLEAELKNLVELENKLKDMCSFNFDDFIKFIVYVLTELENKSYEIYLENGIYIIRPVGMTETKDFISFEVSEKIDLLSTDFVNESSDIAKRYPYLKNIIMDLIYYKNNVFNSYLNDRQIFNYMQMIFPINYQHLIKEDMRVKIAEELKPLARDLVRDITSDLENFSKKYKYRTSIEEGLKLFEALKEGKYNDLVNKKYWFGYNLSSTILTRWNMERNVLEKEGQICGEISIENYKIFAAIDHLIDHLNDVNEKGEYETHYIGRPQTAATAEEQISINKLLTDVLKRNYNWREARDVVRNIAMMEIYNNYNFPHNIDEIIKSFNPVVTTYFAKIADTDNLKIDLEELKKRALEMAKNITPQSLPKLFHGQSKDGIDEYLRRMILSQFDIVKLVHNSRNGNFRQNLEIVIQELSISTNMSHEVLMILFSDLSNNKQLADLARGTLLSLCYDKKVSNILGLCVEIQKNLNCWYGTVGQNDVNSLRLPNGDVIYSTYCEDIKPQYNNFQKEYELYYNETVDLEFLEGCSEIFGKVLITQIFREGNKRTAKCLYNALLVSRGIMPPIADLNENERSLWDEFAYGRFDRFQKARLHLLMEALNVNKKIKSEDFSLPINLTLDAVNRSEFNQRGY